MSEFSENLKLCRMCAGLTQKEMAIKINKEPSSYRHYEHDRAEPSYKTLIFLCRFFGVTPNDLLGIES